MPIGTKYIGDESTGHAFEVGAILTVVVTNEELDVASGYEGDNVTYTATVLDEDTGKLPAAFVTDLVIDSTVLVNDQAFDAGHYSQATGLLTLAWVVPAITAGNYTVKMDWEDQVI
jgi:hypothetical protein